MHLSQTLPEIVIARVLVAGGPYRTGDDVSLALNVEGIGRLIAHDAAVRAACGPFERAVVPEIISALVTHPALSYGAGDVLTLSFVDPQIVRVAAGGERSAPASVASPASGSPHPGRGAPPEVPLVAGLPSATPLVADAICEAPLGTDAPLVLITVETSESEDGDAASVGPTPDEPAVQYPSAFVLATDVRKAVRIAGDDERKSAISTRSSKPGVFVRLDWSRERLRRFVAVVDKLFTIDRLGWYRHALAMRLLIPDTIDCGDAQADLAANEHLRALRSAALSAFGNPLLAACMPNFTVTSEWLQTIEGAGEARAIAGLRDALLPYVEDDAAASPEPDTAYTVGTIARHELLALGALSVDAFLPILIATASHDATLTRYLLSYRHLLIELFGQTAHCGELVRLNQMAQPSHSLDDRLWHLAGAAGEAFGGQALA